ncbi:hypothetical protein CEN39_13050 [Fischerella thermalis CCMEE 5201]|nr:hypothetical protein CEN39_13050 [Fischerella thermalis CCMEE 5201]
MIQLDELIAIANVLWLGHVVETDIQDSASISN